MYFIFDISAICWIGFIWNYLYWNGVWGLLKYLQCNKANAEKFQNIFMWNALILVLVEMPKFKFIGIIQKLFLHEKRNREIGSFFSLRAMGALTGASPERA